MDERANRRIDEIDGRISRAHGRTDEINGWMERKSRRTDEIYGRMNEQTDGLTRVVDGLTSDPTD